MSHQTTPDPANAISAQTVRSPLKNLLANLPEILMIGIAIWVLDFTAIFSFIGIFHTGLIIGIALALLFCAPALWASWQTLKLAILPPVLTVPARD